MLRGNALGSNRFLTALAILVVFNAAAVAWVVAVGLPAQPWVFAAWFVGDIVVGLIVVGLTDRG